MIMNDFVSEMGRGGGGGPPFPGAVSVLTNLAAHGLHLFATAAHNSEFQIQSSQPLRTLFKLEIEMVA
jgi:hypothetical protein